MVRFIRFALYPIKGVLFCILLFVIVIATLALLLGNIPHEKFIYNIVFALTTGAAGSLFVSIVIELIHNYYHNYLSWLELKDLHYAVWEYETNKKIVVNSDTESNVNNTVDETETVDLVDMTWKLLPCLIPVLKDTIDNKKAYLTHKEINYINSILSSYETIRLQVRDQLYYVISYDCFRNPKEESLFNDYPRELLLDLPERMRKLLSKCNNMNKIDQLTDFILSNTELLDYCMIDYDISQKSLDYFCNQDDKNDDCVNNEPCKDSDTMKPENEKPENTQVFQCKGYDRVKVKNRIEFISGVLSESCEMISDNVDLLEKEMNKKPYYMTLEEYKIISSIKSNTN